MKLSIGVNLLYLRPGEVGGSETYCRALIRELAGQRDVELILFAMPAAARSFRPGRSVSIVPVGSGDWTMGRRLYHETFTLRRQLRRYPVDVMLSPANFVSMGVSVPQVVTIHDLQHVEFPQNYSRTKWLQRELLFRASVMRASHVIAVSELTRTSVSQRYGVAANRITTVLEGYDRPPLHKDGELRERQRPFVYYPAKDWPHKNHRLLLDVLAHPRCPDLDLVLTGARGSLWEALLAEADARGLGHRIEHLGFVSRERVYRLYRQAEALTFPSRFEGFGLPLLEAMASDTPVLAARCGSIPEVAGEAAVLLDPDDAEAWAEALSALPSQRKRLVAAGRKNLERFSWETCAAQTLDILAKAATMVG